MITQLPREQLLTIIETQTDVARLGPDLAAVMALVTERAQQLTDADGAVIELAEGDEMVYRAASGSGQSQLGLRLARSTSLSGLSVASNEVLLCSDSEQDQRVDLAACRKVGVRSMIVVPLRHQHEVVGVLKVLCREPGHFTPDHGRLLGMLADLIAAAMFHASRLANDDLLYRATHDALTGLANRALFYDRLRQELHQAKRSGEPLGVAIIDMDGLKAINDQLGHRAGDEALRAFGERLKQAARQADTVARLGGDEFALILHQLQPPLAQSVGQRLIAAAEAPFAYDGQCVPVGGSIGIALWPEDGDTAEQLIEVADQRMYANKRQRKDLASG